MTSAPRESATIYQFPAGGRAGLAGQGTAPKRAGFAGNERFAEMPTIAYGGSWYHDEAIREAAEKTRKN